MIDWQKTETSYLLAKAAKLALKYAKGDPEGAVLLLDGFLETDGDLREHVAVVAIYATIVHEDEERIGPAVGRA